MYGWPMVAPLQHECGPRNDCDGVNGWPATVEARGLLDQGLAQEWNFNQHEALRNLRHVTELDPTCSLCWWALARALGPNINRAVANQGAFNAAALQALQTLPAPMTPLTKVERLVRGIQALCIPVGSNHSTAMAARSVHATAACNEADAWERDHDQRDDDLDALCADALMTTTPWDYYTYSRMDQGVGVLKPELEQAARLLRRLTRPAMPAHALALHLYIHLTESTAAPLENTLASQFVADSLLGLVRAGGHLQHMPAHTYLRVGRWEAGVRASEQALRADDLYLARCLQPYGHGHNLRMGGWHARLAGMRSKAIDFAQAHRLDAARLSAVGMSDGGSDGVSGSSSEEALTLVRFGVWEAIDALPPAVACGECLNDVGHRAARAYAAGMAAEASGASSDAEVDALRNFSAGEAASRGAANQVVRSVAGARLMLLELEARRDFRSGSFNASVQALRAASASQEHGVYSEPPTWYYDVRDCLGYVLLHSEPPDAAGALDAHLASLSRFPRSGWALLGAAQALQAMGEERAAEAEAYRAQYQVAWEAADVPLTCPCPQFAPPDEPFRGSDDALPVNDSGRAQLGLVTGLLLALNAAVLAYLCLAPLCRCRNKQPRRLMLSDLPVASGPASPVAGAVGPRVASDARDTNGGSAPQV